MGGGRGSVLKVQASRGRSAAERRVLAERARRGDATQTRRQDAAGSPHSLPTPMGSPDWSCSWYRGNSHRPGYFSPGWHLPMVGPMKPHSCGAGRGGGGWRTEPRGGACRRGRRQPVGRARKARPGSTCVRTPGQAGPAGTAPSKAPSPAPLHLGDAVVHGVGPQRLALGRAGGAVRSVVLQEAGSKSVQVSKADCLRALAAAGQTHRRAGGARGCVVLRSVAVGGQAHHSRDPTRLPSIHHPPSLQDNPGCRSSVIQFDHTRTSTMVASYRKPSWDSDLRTGGLCTSSGLRKPIMSAHVAGSRSER